jgi:type II secretory pathway pseudopilin PulG
MPRLPVHSGIPPHRLPRRGRAFSLLEALVASSIIAVTTVALVSPFSLAAGHQRLDADRTISLSLATQMMERLLLLDYAQVLALDGHSETGNAITDAADQAMNDPTLEGFTRTVSARQVLMPLPGEDEADTAVFCAATVTVTHRGMSPVTITRLFAQE